MGNAFAGSEIVELGVQIEVNGKAFYDSLVRKTKNNEAKKVFAFLADEEEKHVAKFRKILDSVQKYEPKEAYPTEYFSYMNSLASDYVFTKKGTGEEIANNTKSEKEAIDLAIGFEKDSISFYEGMKKVVPDEDQKIIEHVVEEEMKHLKRLEELRGKI